MIFAIDQSVLIALITAPANPAWRFDGEVQLGHLLTSLSILIAALTFTAGWIRDRKLKRREYADKIRAAAAKAAVAVARRREIAVWMYDAMQKAISDADVRFVATGDPSKTRDALWQDLVQIRSEVRRILLNEKVEEAYVAFYGYDTDVREKYQKCLRALDDIDENAYEALLMAFQEVIRDVTASKPREELRSADLGNPLRGRRQAIRNAAANAMQMIVEEFQEVMATVIRSSDREILDHTPQ